MKKIILALLLSISNSGYSQLKNNLDFGLLGNIGFLHLGYNREIINENNIGIEFGPKIGYVPGSQEEERNAIPNFIHVNFGSNVFYKLNSFRIGTGLSYSFIFIGNDKYDVKEKNRYERFLGDLSLTYFFSKNEYERTGVKLSFVPILNDTGANDV